MTEMPRYAIYYAPDADSGLARFGREMLGYDAVSGGDVAFPADVVAQVSDWQENWHDVTRDPRKYGFHATLKAPFTWRMAWMKSRCVRPARISQAACAPFR